MMQRRMHVAILKLKNEMRIVTAEYRSRNKTKKNAIIQIIKNTQAFTKFDLELTLSFSIVVMYLLFYYFIHIPS
jgi:hypothetical protein